MCNQFFHGSLSHFNVLKYDLKLWFKSKWRYNDLITFQLMLMVFSLKHWKLKLSAHLILEDWMCQHTNEFIFLYCFEFKLTLLRQAAPSQPFTQIHEFIYYNAMFVFFFCLFVRWWTIFAIFLQKRIDIKIVCISIKKVESLANDRHPSTIKVDIIIGLQIECCFRQFFTKNVYFWYFELLDKCRSNSKRLEKILHFILLTRLSRRHNINQMFK